MRSIEKSARFRDDNLNLTGTKIQCYKKVKETKAIDSLSVKQDLILRSIYMLPTLPLTIRIMK
jgi:hypothetical protein